VFKPGKVTPKALKIVKKFKLDATDPSIYRKALLDVAADEEALKEVCSAIFSIPEDDVDEEMDLSGFHEGLSLFFQGLLKPSNG